MDELEKILNAVSGVTGVDRHDILMGKSRYDIMYRDMTCHIIVEFYSHLTRRFAYRNGWELNKVYMRAKRFRTEKGIDKKSLDHLVAQIRRKIDYVPKDEPKDEKEDDGMAYNPSRKSFAKTLFGFEYTDRDDYFRKKAIYESARYMREYCRF